MGSLKFAEKGRREIKKYSHMFNLAVWRHCIFEEADSIGLFKYLNKFQFQREFDPVPKYGEEL